MSAKVQDLLRKLHDIEKQLKKDGIYIPEPDEEYSGVTKQRDKLTGNTKSQKKKQKNAHETFLKARIEQLTKLLRSENKAEDGVEEDGEYTVYEI